MRAATGGKHSNPIRVRDLARFTFGHDQILARHCSPRHIGPARASPAIDAITITQEKRPTLQHVSCPAANASTSQLHIICVSSHSLSLTQEPTHSDNNIYRLSGWALMRSPLRCDFEDQTTSLRCAISLTYIK